MSASMLRTVVILFILSGQACCQDSGVFAKIGVEPITQKEIDFHLGRPSGSRPLPLVVRENALQLMALQRQALQTLRKQKVATDLAEVRKWAVENYGTESEQESGEEIIAKLAMVHGVSENTVQDHIAFRLSWKQYLAKHLVAKNLVRHFQNQKQRFDGTRFRIRLLTIPASAGQSEVRQNAESVLSQAREELGEIATDAEIPETLLEKGKIESSESRWVRGMGDVDNRLIDFAIQLEPGDWSEVFHTATGVHLLQVLETEPGERELEEVRGEVRVHMLVFLLERLASQSQKQVAFVSASQ